MAEHIINAVNAFKAVLKSKRPQALLDWMENTSAIGIVEFDGALLPVLNVDIDAVLNLRLIILGILL